VGSVVLCDRFFDSTFAYQAIARGLGEELVRTANELGSCGRTPDATVVFDLDPQVAWGRATRGGADRLEAEGVAFQERVRQGYLRAAELEPSRVLVVDADGTPEEVFARTIACLSDVLPALSDLDVDGFFVRQAALERAMADITPSVAG
jgi:dTMP kinase